MTDERVTEAQRLRAEGLTFMAIAARLGVGTATVQRWCKPDFAERQRQYSRAWKAANLERKRAYDVAYDAEHKVPCPGCGKPMWRGRCKTVCLDCHRARHREMAERFVAMWAQGLLLKDIAAEFGWSRGLTGKRLHDLRQEGYDLPYRYEAVRRRHEQVAA